MKTYFLSKTTLLSILFSELLIISLALIFISTISLFAQNQSREVGKDNLTSPKNLITTGITGSNTSYGLDSPQYILSFIPVQEIVLKAAQGPLSEEFVKEKLADIEPTLDNLLNLKILRQKNDQLYLNYLLLTKNDQEKIYEVAKTYAYDLANKIYAEKKFFKDLMTHSGIEEELADETLFVLVAGILLNWEGLKIATNLGYRPERTEYPNGDKYILHSAELGIENFSSGLYSGSHSTTTNLDWIFSTFGDANSIPRLKGIPDLYETIYENGFNSFKKDNDVLVAITTHYVTYINEVEVKDAGMLMASLAQKPKTESSLKSDIGIPQVRFDATLNLLSAFNYISIENGIYKNTIPVFTPKQKGLVDASLQRGEQILQKWLSDNYPQISQDLNTLTPMKNGLPFSLVFNEVWHYLFGFTSKILAEKNFYVNPRNPDYSFEGYVPLLWSSSIYDF
ncbi:MAG: hypothetical protein ABJK11_04735 [Balneola sp.]